MSETDKWVEKEQKQLSGAATRLSLLHVIYNNQHEGLYGYKIGEELSELTFGELNSSTASYYAILRRLRLDGLIDPFREEKSVGPTRTYYRLTDRGIEAHDRLWQEWKYYYRILHSMIEKTTNK